MPLSVLPILAAAIADAKVGASSEPAPIHTAAPLVPLPPVVASWYTRAPSGLKFSPVEIAIGRIATSL